jgi:very-short-patch-repair endonuclease
MGMVSRSGKARRSTAHDSSLPPADVLLWEELQRVKAPGVRFGRELFVGSHIISLCCRASRIAVEINLPAPDKRTPEDIDRIDTLLGRGYAIVNVKSENVYCNLVGVCDAIRRVATNCARQAGRTDQVFAPYLTTSDTASPFQDKEENGIEEVGMIRRTREIEHEDQPDQHVRHLSIDSMTALGKTPELAA